MPHNSCYCLPAGDQTLGANQNKPYNFVDKLTVCANMVVNMHVQEHWLSLHSLSQYFDVKNIPPATWESAGVAVDP